MNLEIEVISREIIKPSSPTPDDLRHYQLSFLDQISPPVYNPLILFYPNDHGDAKFNIQEISEQLKQSLSEVLTDFYPLAGRIKDNLFVDCNDEGIPYLEAKVLNCQLFDVIENPVPDELKKLIPFELDGVQEVPLGIQLNIFDCGGVAVSFGISHKIGDALSMITFVKFWAGTARGVEGIPRPHFISANLFPPKNLGGFKPSTGITRDKVVTKRFVFRTPSIEAIKAMCCPSSSPENEKPPSRIEALSVFMWTRFMASTKSQSIPQKIYFMLHAVNLRTRMEPPLPDHSFGNYYRVAITVPRADINGEEGYYDAIRQVRESIRKIDKEYVEALKEGNQHLDFIKERAERFIRGEMASLNFTSLCRFPLYEADFGWGKPLWVGSPSLTFKNLVVFMDTASGDGIEALVHLNEEDMAHFQEDQVLLSFVSLTS